MQTEGNGSTLDKHVTCKQKQKKKQKKKKCVCCCCPDYGGAKVIIIPGNRRERDSCTGATCGPKYAWT